MAISMLMRTDIQRHIETNKQVRVYVPLGLCLCVFLYVCLCVSTVDENNYSGDVVQRKEKHSDGLDHIGRL